MRTKLLLSSLTLMLGIGIGTAFAEEAYTDEEQEACQADAMRLCSDAVPDVDRVTACMKQHISSLSPPCAKMFDSERPRPHRHK
ncbi:hypothetical protein [Beijerinckia indica]|uniref:Cysteine rich repeat-containing protein n=1 Tax=Beijerinckia indica subsp. indica (strain ATCC 9039 / DSM 1715 / NCIMB 8712) TaxID=395963 RepID=B2IFP2_BEII9|nr:hypothetical protein [Beijerinckia indica]ACB94253.1 conserved hypothetical protein [Beijerinckia indica subsp. indica ATCC 9039]